MNLQYMVCKRCLGILSRRTELVKRENEYEYRACWHRRNTYSPNDNRQIVIRNSFAMNVGARAS
jgi:hypothetical protein